MKYYISGLQDEYYDACLGWSPTVERIHYAQFSVPFGYGTPSYFWYKDSFDTGDFTNKKIGN